jgi:acetamidase/formamidase
VFFDFLMVLVTSLSAESKKRRSVKGRGRRRRIAKITARSGPPAGVHAETPAGLVTFGFSPNLNQAMGDALDAMVTWMAELYGTSRAEALALASTCVDPRITQVVNITWGVHALLPSSLLT